MWPRIPSGIVTLVFYLQFCTPFCDKNGNLAHNDRFLLQMKREATDKTVGQRFLKEFKATWGI